MTLGKDFYPETWGAQGSLQKTLCTGTDGRQAGEAWEVSTHSSFDGFPGFPAWGLGLP